MNEPSDLDAKPKGSEEATPLAVSIAERATEADRRRRLEAAYAKGVENARARRVRRGRRR